MVVDAEEFEEASYMSGGASLQAFSSRLIDVFEVVPSECNIWKRTCFEWASAGNDNISKKAR